MKGRRVVLSPTTKSKLGDLLEFLEDKWSAKVKNDFIKKLDKSILQISHYPQSCPESVEVKGLYKCVVTKQNSLFYRVSPDEIEIITLFDTRQDPSKIAALRSSSATTPKKPKR
ncbi:type II toxin-antitoxin system RelE/ParE family toxin [Marinoscillum furvescens]|uniref:Plasmid stabilization system protein ParE n=1 Tax=Marinoscillum furvescens DSM 4134 TaxID=1122208 RepID=A0A3D9KVH0_MARFU|nr:type II toxin-antitoxin system RelE/ParE family toxin [Marinoscillum furvescens]RED91308.1 plasmid stabilization system protein ParE [Marinoscillum furvescens DSM 4134]